MIRKLIEEREEGFTLIELLVVVIIIGILAAIAIPAFLNQREGAYRSAVESDLRNIAIEMETFFSAHDEYPAVTTAAGVATLTGSGATPPTETYQLSDNVTVASGAAANVAAGTFCVTGDHSQLGAGVDAVYDSDGGGLRTDTDCTP